MISIARVTEHQGETHGPVRDFFPVERVGANMVAMLDDFLAVVPRKPSESDDKLLIRTEACTTRFDDLLKTLGLPKAARTRTLGSQSCGFGSDSVQRQEPTVCQRRNGRRLYVESKLMSKASEVGITVDVSSLLTVLCKFHHATLTWPAGRPCLYALWRL